MRSVEEVLKELELDNYYDVERIKEEDGISVKLKQKNYITTTNEKREDTGYLKEEIEKLNSEVKYLKEEVNYYYSLVEFYEDLTKKYSEAFENLKVIRDRLKSECEKWGF